MYKFFTNKIVQNNLKRASQISIFIRNEKPIVSFHDGWKTHIAIFQLKNTEHEIWNIMNKTRNSKRNQHILFLF